MSVIRLRQLCGVAGMPKHVGRVKDRLSRAGIEVTSLDTEGGPAWHCREADLPEPIRRELIAGQCAPDDSGNAKRAPDDVRALARAELRSSGASQVELAREAGISETVLSQFLGDTYPGDNERVAAALTTCLEARARRSALPEIVTGNPFLETRAALRVLDAIGFVHDTCGVALVTGKPGVGKTRGAREYGRRARNVWHVTILEGGHSPVMTLRAACAELGIATEVNWSVLDLHARMVAKLAGKRALLVVDEAQHLGAAGLDAIRQVFDAAEMGLVLMGHTDLADTVGKMPQLKSRLTRRVRLGAADPRGDVAVIAAEFGVKSREAVELLADFARLEGGLRNVLNTLKLAAIRAFGRAVETADIAEAWRELELGEGA